MKDKDISSLEHTAWRCQYHIEFAPKYRRMEILGVILRKWTDKTGQLCQQKGVEIIEAQACPDHIHMLVSIPPKYSVSQIMGYLKGKSSLMIFDRHANLKYKYGNGHFWARGYQDVMHNVPSCNFLQLHIFFNSVMVIVPSFALLLPFLLADRSSLRSSFWNSCARSKLCNPAGNRSL